MDQYKNQVITEPLRIGEIINRSLKYTKQIFSSGCFVLVAYALFTSGLTATYLSAENLDLISVNTILGVAVLVCVMWLFKFIFLVAVIIAANSLWIQRDLSLVAALSKITIKQCLSFLSLGIRVGTISALGFILFIIPGLIYSINRSLSAYALIIDGLSIDASLTRSKYLMTQDNWYSLSGPWTRISVLLTINIVMSIALGVLFSFTGDQIGGQYLGKFIESFATLAIDIFTTVALAGFYRDLCNRYAGKDLLGS